MSRQLTPSDVLARYCTPVAGADGRFLCDVSRRRQPRRLFDIDIDEALAAAAADAEGGDGAVEDTGMPAVEDEFVPGAAAVEQPFEMSMTSSGIDMKAVAEASPEPLPLVLGGLLIAACVAFTAFTLFVVFRKRQENHKAAPAAAAKDEGDVVSSEQQPDESLPGSATGDREGKMQAAGQHNSWVFGNLGDVSASVSAKSSEYSPSLRAIGEDADGPEEADIGGSIGNSWVFGGRADVEGDERHETIMSWKDLSCSYPNKKSGGEDITTLSGVTGHIQYTELVAIMGGSGGGKSTLMDILSGRKVLGNLGGEMSVLGESMAPKSTDCKDILRDVAAYVPQNEQFFPNQTPEEAVEFVANLKLGKDDRGYEMRKKRVDQILDLVGIPEAARKRAIGGTLAGGVVIRGLSGGERKRLALACAVAMKPKLLFLDEITSGLDSENAVLVIDLIKKVCVNMNVAAAVVIHQPSYEVFSHFDRLVLLSKGKCVYADKLDNIPSFYGKMGRDMPENYLIPNDILKVAADWSKTGATLSEQSHDLVKSSGKKLLQEVKSRKKPSLFLQFETVLLRQLVNHYMRNITNLLARVLIYDMSMLLLGLIFWKIAETDGEPLSFDQAQATFGAGIFMTQIYYLLPFCQISTFFFDKNLFASESSIGLYPAWIYSACQVTLEVWVMSLCALTSSAIAVPMMSLHNPSVSKLASFVTMFSVFAVGGIVGNSIIMLTSIILWSQDLAFLVGSANVVLFLATSGGFVPFPYIEDWIVWLQWISPIKYSFQGFAWALLSETSTEKLLETLELDAPSSTSANILVLIGIFLFCAAGSVVALSRQREVR